MKQNKEKLRDFDSISKAAEGVNKHLDSARKSTFKRFPRLFLLLSTFGFVMLLHGFESTVDNIPFFEENPFFVLLLGIAILLFTGTLYKKMK